ncbi:hypothetical protein GM658_25905 [Pseudoduganella eburnea]|uniref:Uncharacterized protein n=1 Tax=Massilia eburnea TaxID=1776165 RepID=A0A6L6QPM9_9BURK|nr:hypothetical protein [Massilia eburnea]
MTIVSTANEISQSQVKVRRVGANFVIDPSGISRDYCGAGAEWPRTIAIEPGKKKCKVSR